MIGADDATAPADPTPEGAAAPPDRTTQPNAPLSELDAAPEVLTVKDVAKLLRVHTNTVYQMAARGDLPRKQMGRLVRFTKAGIRRYLES